MIEYRVQIKWYNGFQEDYRIFGGPESGVKEEIRLSKFGNTLDWYNVTRITPEEKAREKKHSQMKEGRVPNKYQQEFIDKLYEIDARAKENPVYIPTNKTT